MVEEVISPELVKELTAATAWRYRMVPYDKKGGILHCYSDSISPQLEQELGIVVGSTISVSILASAQVDALLNEHYGSAAVGKASTSAKLSVGGGFTHTNEFLFGLIAEAHASSSSDIHIEAYEEECRIRLRIDGKLVQRYTLAKDTYPAFINQIKILANLDISEKRLPQDGRILFNRDGVKLDLRVSVLPSIYGEKVVLRLLTRSIELLDIHNLGLNDTQLAHYLTAIRKPHGLILISGPTGSGKTTTLYATLRELNSETVNILTIEDPVEYTLHGVNQVALKDEIGLTFPEALRTFLRQDPDIIMLGEIRDPETAQMAIRSALTGHLIFSTIHTNSAWGTVARLADMSIPHYLVADTLNMVIAQRLVRLLCPHCKRKVYVSELNHTFAYLVEDSSAVIYQPVGCDACLHTGYKGRKAIYEVIPIDRELTEQVKQGNFNVSELLRQKQIKTLRDSALELLSAGATSLDEIVPILIEL
ncbi:GspE/PulE family protein [uncultured Acetobacteroides sp.]|uniref:GspE/PulE family protein n=1 Tax=uncultured Acetobacteroides sp. TaxID=1760811 RepID=UPI0029F50C04|nr:GspE/PulE family protein [uncultured Acetobacteroides sp.]